MCDSCKLVCVVVRHVIRLVTREKNQLLGTTQIHSFYIGDPAFEHAAMSNNDLVPMNHISVKLSTFWAQDPAMWFLQAEAGFRSTAVTTFFFHNRTRPPLPEVVECATPTRARWAAAWAALRVGSAPSSLVAAAAAAHPTGSTADEPETSKKRSHPFTSVLSTSSHFVENKNNKIIK